MISYAKSRHETSRRGKYVTTFVERHNTDSELLKRKCGMSFAAVEDLLIFLQK
jgi:hypothetical protein